MRTADTEGGEDGFVIVTYMPYKGWTPVTLGFFPGGKVPGEKK